MWLQAFFAQETWAAPPGWLWFWGDHDLLLSLDSGGGVQQQKWRPRSQVETPFESKFWIHFGWHSRLKNRWMIYIYIIIHKTGDNWSRAWLLLLSGESLSACQEPLLAEVICFKYSWFIKFDACLYLCCLVFLFHSHTSVSYMTLNKQ